MKDKSLSRLLRTRKIVRYGTILAMVAVVAIAIPYFVSKNPRIGKGATQPDQYAIDSSKIINMAGGGKTELTIENSIFAYMDCTWSYNNLCYSSSRVEVDLSKADVTIDGADVIFSGANHFKSLVVKNNGEATHRAVELSDSESDAGNKKVDVELDGDLTLDSGGRINATGKGYPGSQESNSWVSGGPGKGQPGQNGGGGGYGGEGNGNSSPDYGKVYGNDLIDVLYVGSGGGGTNSDKFADGIGGRGGGCVHISAKNIRIAPTSTISANGTNGNGGAEYRGGGGSGGSIKLEFADSIPLSPSTLGGVGNIGPATRAASGTIKYVDILGNDNVSFETNANVVANGGDGYGSAGGSGMWYAGGGGGGRILIKKITVEVPSITIKKKLEPVSREGLAAGHEREFNPYGLQLNDVIDVVLDVTNLVPAGTTGVRDEVLHLFNGSVKCVPTGAIDVQPPGSLVSNTEDSDSITFNVTGQKSVTIRYACKVKKL